MSRAYCLTCNEPVQETPSGTCPLGHPVSAPDGPEPWVGFAGDGTITDEVVMHRVDPSGATVPAGVGHTNGSHGSANGHLAATPPPAGPTRAPAVSQASDDLAAMLADALRSHESDESPAVDDGEARMPAADEATPVADALMPDSGADAPPTDEGWDELAGLAAELQLEGHSRADDGPAAGDPGPIVSSDPEPVTPQPEPVVPGQDDPAASTTALDEFLAEFDEPAAPAPVDPPAPNSTPLWDEPPAAVAPAPPPVDPTPVPMPPPPVDLPPPAPVPPPPPPATEPMPAADPDPLAEDVGSSAPALDAVVEPDPAVPAAAVDLSNFTARGRRVGLADTSAPRRRKWKR